MLQLERNRPIDTEVLSEFFARCGWKASAGTTALEWAMAAADEWVACKLDGELVGFARSCRLGPSHRVVFDALVDPRFEDTSLRSVIVKLLAATAGDLERVTVFGEKPDSASVAPHVLTDDYGRLYIPTAPPSAYLGKRRS